MTRFFHGLTFRIGIIIILSVIIIMAIVGYIYIDSFSEAVDKRIKTQVSIPGKLMDAGLLLFDSISDSDIMRQLVGEELIEGMVVGANNIVFFSQNPDYIGKNITEVPNLNANLFNIANLQNMPIYEKGTVVNVSPIFSRDGQTPRFFVYIKTGTGTTNEEKSNIGLLFVIGSIITIIFTSAIIILSFKRIILNRITDILNILLKVQTGDLSISINKPISKDEIGVLEKGLNAMIAERERTEEALTEEHNLLHTLMDN